MEDWISAASSRGSTFKQYNMAISNVRVTLSKVPSASMEGRFFRADKSCRASLFGRGAWQAKQYRHSAKSCLWSVMKSTSCCLWYSSPIPCPRSSLSSSFWTSSSWSCSIIVVINPETKSNCNSQNLMLEPCKNYRFLYWTLFLLFYNENFL